jgi:hypothetical protein
MAGLLVRRDQFNITPGGIVHKPTDAAFIPSPGDPLKGTLRLGSLGAALPNGDKFCARPVNRMMHDLWKEYVKANQALFNNKTRPLLSAHLPQGCAGTNIFRPKGHRRVGRRCYRSRRNHCDCCIGLQLREEILGRRFS